MHKLIHDFKSNKGFTMLEGMLGIILLSLTTIGLYSAVILAQNISADARYITEATNYARKKLEKIIDTDFNSITQNYISGVNYDVNPYDSQTYYTDPDGDYTSTLPNAKWQVEYFHPPSGIDPLVIRLTVSWRKSVDNEPEHQVQFSTKLTAGRM